MKNAAVFTALPFLVHKKLLGGFPTPAEQQFALTAVLILLLVKVQVFPSLQIFSKR